MKRLIVTALGLLVAGCGHSVDVSEPLYSMSRSQASESAATSTAPSPAANAFTIQGAGSILRSCTWGRRSVQVTVVNNDPVACQILYTNGDFVVSVPSNSTATFNVGGGPGGEAYYNAVCGNNKQGIGVFVR